MLFRSSMSFASSQPIAAVTLRETRNTQGEPLYTTLPVVNPDSSSNASFLVFPQIAAGGGYATQLLLMNTGVDALKGRIQLTASDGLPLLVNVAGNTVADLAYEIPPLGVFRAELRGVSEKTNVGYAVVTSESGTRLPAGSAIFQLRDAEGLVTEAGVGATPTGSASRIYVDYAATQTGFAIANPGDLTAAITLTLMDRWGGVRRILQQSLPARGHTARFVHELFPEIGNGFDGLLEIRSTTPVAAITLKVTTNRLNRPVLTTLPVLDLSVANTATTIFPHLAIGGGFSTSLIVLNQIGRAHV